MADPKMTFLQGVTFLAKVLSFGSPLWPLLWIPCFFACCFLSAIYWWEDRKK
jgi:hypothetical protein